MPKKRTIVDGKYREQAPWDGVQGSYPDRPTKVDLRKAQRLYTSGRKLKEVARILGCATSTVWYALKQSTNTRLRPAHFSVKAYSKAPAEQQLRYKSKGTEYMEHYPGIGWFCNGKDISEMMSKAIRGQLDCPKPDAVLNIETHLFNTILTADTCDYSLDVGKNLWLNKGRWSRLIKEYISADDLQRFIDQSCEIMTGTARLGATSNMMFRDPDRYAKKHRWGGCLMGASFRGDSRKSGRATITFYSRTTYIAYMGLLDSGIAHLMAKAMCKQVNDANKGPWSLKDISFRWHLSSQQLHSFKTLPYVYSQPDLMARLNYLKDHRRLLESVEPSWKYLAKWYFKVTDGWDLWCSERGDNKPNGWLSTEKYGPFRRIKRRWLEYKGLLKKNVPPSLKISYLDFSKAYSTNE